MLTLIVNAHYLITDLIAVCSIGSCTDGNTRPSQCVWIYRYANDSGRELSKNITRQVTEKKGEQSVQQGEHLGAKRDRW